MLSRLRPNKHHLQNSEPKICKRINPKTSIKWQLNTFEQTTNLRIQCPEDVWGNWDWTELIWNKTTEHPPDQSWTKYRTNLETAK